MRLNSLLFPGVYQLTFRRRFTHPIGSLCLYCGTEYEINHCRPWNSATLCPTFVGILSTRIKAIIIIYRRTRHVSIVQSGRVGKSSCVASSLPWIRTPRAPQLLPFQVERHIWAPLSNTPSKPGQVSRSARIWRGTIVIHRGELRQSLEAGEV